METASFIKPLLFSLLLSLLGLKFLYDALKGHLPDVCVKLGISTFPLILTGILLQVPTTLFVYVMLTA